jgi:CDGSH iron-sulfur domain-containing protein 3
MEKPVTVQKRPYVLPADPGTYWWCSCGRSAQQPFCDGSHKGTSLKPVKAELAEAGTIAWCGCKHSGKGAFCDGTHSHLPE